MSTITHTPPPPPAVDDFSCFTDGPFPREFVERHRDRYASAWGLPPGTVDGAIWLAETPDGGWSFWNFLVNLSDIVRSKA